MHRAGFSFPSRTRWHHSAPTFFSLLAPHRLRQWNRRRLIEVWQSGKVYSERFELFFCCTRYLFSLSSLFSRCTKGPFRVQMWRKLKSRVKSGNSVQHKGGVHSIRKKSELRICLSETTPSVVIYRLSGHLYILSVHRRSLFSWCWIHVHWAFVWKLGETASVVHESSAQATKSYAQK